jgi:septum formation protein
VSDSALPIYLASRSARRREILRQLGVPFVLLPLREAAGRPVDVDETSLPGEAPTAYVQRVARLKAEAAWGLLEQRRLPVRPVLGADTTVAAGGEILGKPANRADAMRMLRLLSGGVHAVHTAVALRLHDRLELRLSSTNVEFKPLDEQTIAAYVDCGEPMDKAGAYAVQGKAAMFVKHLQGSYTGVVGLPAWETAELLGAFGYRLP